MMKQLKVTGAEIVSGDGIVLDGTRFEVVDVHREPHPRFVTLELDGGGWRLPLDAEYAVDRECCPSCELVFKKMRSGTYMAEVGEFWDPKQQKGVVMHAQCGIDAGLELA